MEHYKHSLAAIRRKSNLDKAGFDKAFDNGHCILCGQVPKFFNPVSTADPNTKITSNKLDNTETHENVLILIDNAVVHICTDCITGKNKKPSKKTEGE